jgi:hypothetical protein
MSAINQAGIRPVFGFKLLQMIILNFFIIIPCRITNKLFMEKNRSSQKAKKSMVKPGAVMDTVLHKKHPENASLNRKKHPTAKFKAKSRLFVPLSLAVWTRQIYGRCTCLARMPMGN